MSRLAALLSLIAALSGTPLRQAEAASDLSRTAAERHQGDRLESPDGGVGDEADVSIRGGSQPSPAADHSASVDPPLLPPPDGVPPLSAAESGALRERAGWPPTPANRRHAWLQVFRF